MPAAVRVFVVLLFAYFLSYFYRAVNAVISPDIASDLSLSPAQLGLMTSLYPLAFALTQLPLGGFLDRYGPRFVHPVLLCVGALGAFVFAQAQSFEALSLGRFLIGAGMAAALMGALKAFSLWFPPERFASVSSLYVALGGLGPIAAATPLVWVKEEIGWRGVFEYGAAAVVLAAVLVATLVRNAPPGVALPQAAQGGSFAQIWGNLSFWRIGLLNFMMNGGFLAWQTLWGGAYLYGKGWGALEVGNALFLLSLAAVAGFFVCGLLADRFGLGRVFLSASGLVTSAVLALFLWPAMPDALTTLCFALIGFGGAFNILSLAQARLIFPIALTGRVTTGINFLGFGGFFLLQWGMGVGVEQLGYGAVLLVWAALLALAIGFYLPLMRPKPAGAG
ncbi:MAG: MFS transporter [Meiothermus sp.]|nr:MFS transporter [Meiothermus sp.]